VVLQRAATLSPSATISTTTLCELTPEEQSRARAAYKLLSGMKRVPGQRENHRIDEETLLQWIYAVR
jgi:hypothetical protein